MRRISLYLVAAALPLAALPAAASSPTEGSPEEWSVVEVRSGTVHTEDGTYVIDPVRPVPPPSVRFRRTPAPAAAPLAETFQLHSKPGSLHTMFLDFDGTTVTGTAWNAKGLASAFYQGWSLDGDYSTFSAAERTDVQEVWAIVAEDFAPFDVDVTTEDPGAAAITRANEADTRFGTRALISNSDAAATSICGGACSGVAYLDVFDTPVDHARFQPAWIFGHLQTSDNPKPLAETISHEVGHNFNLEHDGDLGTEYYEGHGSWTPIMGFSDFRPISQWSVGDYPGADNTQNDVNVIANHGAPLRTDEGSTWPTTTSYITNRNDTDAYVLPATCTAPQTITAAPSAVGPNLDISLTVLDSSDGVVAADDPPSAAVNADVASGMGAEVTLNSITDTYRVVVDGVGNLVPAPGYTDFASVGAYTLQLTPGCAPGPDTAPELPTSVTGSLNSAGSATLSWQPPANDGGSAITAYEVSRDSGSWLLLGPGARSHVFSGLSNSSHTLSVRAVNAVGTGPRADVVVTPTVTAPSAARIGKASSGAKGGKVTAKATWRAPTSNGGAQINGYRIYAYKLNSRGQVVATFRTVWVGANLRSANVLLNRGRYRFAVLARNSAGKAPRSARSNAVTAR